jgi:hypothetical protein
MELASGMGFPPPWGTREDYHLFFQNVNSQAIRCGRFMNRPYTNQMPFDVVRKDKVLKYESSLPTIILFHVSRPQ